MVAQPLEIHIDPESETGRQLAEAKGRPIRLVVGDGARYRVEPDTDEGVRSGGRLARLDADDLNDPFGDYDAERAAAVWRASFGVWKGMDIEALKAELREQRGQDSPGRPAW